MFVDGHGGRGKHRDELNVKCPEKETYPKGESNAETERQEDYREQFR